MPEQDHEQEAIDELRAAFTIFDREGKGFVEIREAKSLFYTLGIKIRKKTIRASRRRLSGHLHMRPAPRLHAAPF